MLQFYFKVPKIMSAKFCAPRALVPFVPVLYVLSCLMSLLPYVVSCFTWLVPYVLFYPTYLVPHLYCVILLLVPDVPYARRTLVLPEPRVLRALRPMCRRALWTLFPYAPLLPCTFVTLCANIIFSALEFLWLTILILCLFLTMVYQNK